MKVDSIVIDGIRYLKARIFRVSVGGEGWMDFFPDKTINFADFSKKITRVSIHCSKFELLKLFMEERLMKPVFETGLLEEELDWSAWRHWFIESGAFPGAMRIDASGVNRLCECLDSLTFMSKADMKRIKNDFREIQMLHPQPESDLIVSRWEYDRIYNDKLKRNEVLAKNQQLITSKYVHAVADMLSAAGQVTNRDILHDCMVRSMAHLAKGE